MYTELVLFRNELKNKTVPKYKVIGIVSQLLLSRKIFPANLDIEAFLGDVFSLELKAYLFRSRTLITARVTREILAIENDSVYKKKLYDFIQSKILLFKDEAKEAKNQFDGWI